SPPPAAPARPGKVQGRPFLLPCVLPRSAAALPRLPAQSLAAAAAPLPGRAKAGRQRVSSRRRHPGRPSMSIRTFRCLRPWALLLVLPALPCVATPSLPEPALLWQATGFSAPESVVYDADRDLFYVSNMGTDRKSTRLNSSHVKS